MKSKLKRFLLEACVIFTAVTFLMNLVLVIRFSATESGANFSGTRTVLFLPCALFLSAATAVRLSDKITPVLKWILHCALCVSGIFFFAILPGVSEAAGSEKLVGFAGTVLIYLVIVLIFAGIVRRVKRAENENKRYSKKF